MITRSKYEGCPEEVAEALKAGLQVKGWFWDGGEEHLSKEGWLSNYGAGFDWPYKYLTGSWYENFSIHNPNEKRKVTTRELALEWAEKNPFTIVKFRGDIRPSQDWKYDSLNLNEYKVLTSYDPENGAVWALLTDMEV